MTEELSETEQSSLRRLPPRWWVLLLKGSLAVGALLAGLWGTLVWYTWMPGEPWRGPPPALDADERALRDRLEGHVRTLADEIGPRHIGAPGSLERSADYIEEQLKEAGYEVERQAVPCDEGTTWNLQAQLTGRGAPDEVVVVGAHYDTVSTTPGADDNATGVAAVLELARLLSTSPQSRTIRFVLFTHEEPPWFKTDRMGSFVYAQQAREGGEAIVAMLALEMLGHYSEEGGSQSLPPPFHLVYPSTGNFVAFVSLDAAAPLVERGVEVFRQHARIASEGMVAPSWVTGADFSDHWSFLHHGYPAMMVTDTAFMRTDHYHRPTDTADRIQFDYLTHVVLGLEHVVRDLGGGEE